MTSRAGARACGAIWVGDRDACSLCRMPTEDATRSLTAEQLFPHLERLLEPPLERSTDPSSRARPSARGTYAGRRTSITVQADVHDFTDDGTSYLQVAMAGETYGLECAATPMPSVDGVKTGEPAFDSAFYLSGAPRAVLVELFGPHVRRSMIRSPTNVRFEADRVILTTGPKPRSLESAPDQLELGRALLDALPAAIRAAGDERYLALGSLATHPEMVTRDAARRRRRTTLLLIAMATAGALVLGALGLALVMWWLSG